MSALPESCEGSKELEVQDHVAGLYEELRYQRPYSRFYHEWWINKMLSLLTSQGRMLDNGCGTGILSEIKDGFVCGLDFSTEMIKHARKRSQIVALGNSEELPFRDKTFNVVFARSLVHHLQRPDKALDEMSRVLVEGGEIVMVDTNKSILSSLPRRVAQDGGHFSSQHRNLNSEELIKLVGSRFQIDTVLFFGYIAYPLMGFPDIIDFMKFVPFSAVIANILIGVDSVISKLPGIRQLGWGVIVKGTKEAQCQ